MTRTSDNKDDEPDKTRQLWSKVQSIQSPFNWSLPELRIETEKYISNQKSKCEVIEEDNQFQWTRFVSHLILSYELCKLNNYTEALESINWCQEHWNSLSDCNEPLFLDVKEVMAHVILATKARILLSAGKGDLAEKELYLLEHYPYGDVRPLRTMKNRAGLLGLKAATYLQYHTGQSLAIEAARGAKNLDPDQAEWWFILGVALGKARRSRVGGKPNFSEISTEEIESIEKAFTLQKDASYTVHLAQLYGDLSVKMGTKWDTERSRRYAEKAEMRYREALKLRPNCTSLKARVAHGLMKVRSKDRAIIKRLLEEVVDAAPTRGLPYADLGKYYTFVEKDIQKAILNQQMAFEMGMANVMLYLIPSKWTNGYEHQIIDDLKKGLEIYNQNVENLAMIHAYLGTCYLLMDDDWASAIPSFQKSLELDPSAKCLENFRSFDSKWVNLLEMVTNYINYNPIEECQDQAKAFLQEVSEKKPQTLKIIKKHDYTSWKREVLSKKMHRDSDAKSSTGSKRVEVNEAIPNSNSNTDQVTMGLLSTQLAELVKMVNTLATKEDANTRIGSDLRLVREEVNELDEKVDALEPRVTETEDRLEVMENKIETMERALSDIAGLEEIVKEVTNRMKRAPNVVLYSLPEQMDEPLESRIAYDKSLVVKVGQATNQEIDVKHIKARRIGKPTWGKCRPLVVSFDTEKEAKAFLNNFDLDLVKCFHPD
ncbi:uncharacterized protein LOC128993509 [Macrosteles quadrilineatus]|uniref:uncharacterized protein LOC128993509 n=1 Tax=Macrosteles quadrilineatus TaxID=74068 RepID=UPI0023E20E14|nr:uncharacterized protein LOC128993509 [Macrosteles quadrilineatus]